MARSIHHEDPLFLACTRPAMIAGVTLEAMGINVILTSVIFIVGGSLIYGGVGVVPHFLFRGVCKLDHNQFRILFAWVQTKGRARTKSHWGATTFSPLRIKKPRRARELV